MFQALISYFMLFMIAIEEAPDWKEKYCLSLKPEAAEPSGARGSLADLKKRLRVESSSAGDGWPGPEKDEREGGDVRTLSIDYDGQGERYKEWRVVVRESYAEPFSDWPVDGPRTCVVLGKHAEKYGRTPTGWLVAWSREVKMDHTDRTYYELKSIAEVLEYAGCYDQLNLGNLACMELLARRWQTTRRASPGRE